MGKPYSDFRLEVFGNDFKNCNYLSIATSSWRTFPLKKVFFPHSSSVFKRKFSVFSAKILQQIWHKCILYVPRNNWCKTNFLKIKDLTQWLRIFSGLLLRFDKKLQQSCQNFTLYTKSTFWGKTFNLNKSLLTDFFSDCERKVSARFFKHFPTFSEEVFYRKKHFFSKNLVFSRLMQKNLPDIWQKRIGKLLKTAFQLSRGAWFLEKTAFLKMLIFSQIRICSISCLKVLQQLFDSLQIITIQLSTELFWIMSTELCSFFDQYQIFLFTDFNRCNSEHSKKTFWQFCQYGFQRIQRNDWMKFLSYKE